ncbi:MAG: hypothetical protein AAGA99_12965 [Actinomycetota bacterium]
MWHEHCTHCDRDQLFGVRRLVGLTNERAGVMSVAWSCPSCGEVNEIRTGSAVATG